MALKWAKWLRHTCRLGDPHRFRAGGKIRSGPQLGKVATSLLPSRGSPPLKSGGQNQTWPSSGQSGYVTPAVSGIPTASKGGKIRSGPLVGKVATSSPPSRGSPPLRSRGKNQKWPTSGKVATSPLSSQGSPPLRSRGQNQKWPTSGQNGYVTPAVSGIPRGQNQKWPTSGQNGYVTPAVSGIPTAVERGRKSEMAHKWAKWLHHPCRLGDPQRFRAGGKIRSGPLVGKVAMSPLPFRGSPPLQSGGQNQKWPTCWAKWLRHPRRLGNSHRFRARGKIRSGPQLGKVATSPLPSRGSPPLQSGGQNQKWPTCGQSGYVTPTFSGIPTASERGAKSEVAHLWAKWLRHPRRLRDPHRFRAGGKIRSGPQLGKVATSPLPSRGSPPLKSGGQNQTWPSSGQSGYVTPAVSGIPTASERGAKSEVAHNWAKWLCHPCRLGDPHRFRAGGKIRSGPIVGKVATSSPPSRGSPPLRSRGKNQKWPTSGKVATSPLPSQGSPPLRSRGQNQKWPTSGQNGYVTLAVSGIPTAVERGRKSEVAHKWAKWLHHPCRLGDPHRFRAGAKTEVAHLWAKWLRHPRRLGNPHRFRARGKIRSGPQVGKVAMSPLPSRASPPLQSGGQNQKWPT